MSVIASLEITSAPDLPRTVDYFRLENTDEGCRIKHWVSDDLPQERTTQNVVPLSKAVVDELLALLDAAFIPAFPRERERQVDAGELVDLAIYGPHAELHVVWITEPPKGYELLGDFVMWLRAVAVVGMSSH